MVIDLKHQVESQRMRIESMRTSELQQQIIWGDQYRDKGIRDELITYAGLIKQLHGMLLESEESDAKVKALEDGVGIEITEEGMDAFEKLIFEGKITAESLGLGEPTASDTDGEEGL
jgi:hypothetical protein